MINAGVPIVQSLNMLKTQTENKHFQTVIADIAKKVEGGATLANSLSEYPEVFPPIYTNMIRAGETAGILDQVLDRLATQQEKDAEIVKKVKGAMIYPAVISVATIGAFVFLMTVIVPKLAQIFEGLGGDIPIYTKIMLAISKALTTYGWLLAIAITVTVIIISRYVKTPTGKLKFHQLLLKLPIFGNIIRKVNVARFARILGSLMASGVSVVEALNTTAAALGNEVFQTEVRKMATEIKNGKPMSKPMHESKEFPPIVAQMLAVGEETGQMDGILIKLADFFEKEVDNIVSNLTSVIEPILIIVIGTMIGAIVISVFGPLSNLSNTF
jgi:type IV pilus assembly protein PilC